MLLGVFPLTGFTLKWYRDILSGRLYIEGFKNSAIVATFSAIGAGIFIGCALGYAGGILGRHWHELHDRFIVRQPSPSIHPRGLLDDLVNHCNTHFPEIEQPHLPGGDLLNLGPIFRIESIVVDEIVDLIRSGEKRL